MNKLTTNQMTKRIIKKSTCPSVSPNSNAKLSYEIAYEDGTEDILFRVTGNSGGGYMNPVWWKLSGVNELLASAPPDTEFKSTFLKPLFRGISANAPAFACAVLRAEKILAAVPKKPFSSKRGLSGDAYEKSLKKLIDDPKKSLPDTIAKAEAAKQKKKQANAKKLAAYKKKKQQTVRKAKPTKDSA